MTSSETGASSGVPKCHPLDWVRLAGTADRVMEDIASKLARRRRRRARAAGAGLAATLIAVFAFWAVPMWRATSAISTPAANRQNLALADGSTAELSARTDLRMDFRYGRRIVRLTQGEAFFSVTKDPAHPFCVITPAGTVRVIGTRFNVRLAADQKLEVTLVEGRVSIEGVAAKPVGLEPGQQLAFAGSAPVVRTLSPPDLDAATAWRQGLLVLDHLNLAEAAARFGAYHDRKILVAPAIAGLRMGGGCPLNDLQGFLQFLGQALAVTVTTRADGSYSVLPR